VYVDENLLGENISTMYKSKETGVNKEVGLEVNLECSDLCVVP